MASKFDIDAWINKVANNHRIKLFYPTIIAKQTDLPLHDVFNRLLELEKIGYVFVKWEIRCPSYSCSNTILFAESPAKYLGETLSCDVCGEEIQVTLNNTFPIFGVRDDYRESLKKNKQEHQPQVQNHNQVIIKI